RTADERRLAPRRRRVHRACLLRAGSAKPRRALDALRRRAEPLRSAAVLRNARLGLARQSERKLRRLEHERDLRRHAAELTAREIAPKQHPRERVLFFGECIQTKIRIASNGPRMPPR